MWTNLFRRAASRSRRTNFAAGALGVLALLGAPHPARAQLSWGVNGAGGTGNWNTTTANWYDGSTNVPWNGTTAVFGGTAGTVTAAFFLPVQGMVFNVAGYTISGGSLTAPADLNVTANANATLTSTSSSNSISGTFIKNGAGTLTYGGTNFFNNVQINAGEYLATSSSAVFFSNFSFANTAGATLTLGGSSSSVQGLNGGGATGGVVRPGTQGGTLSVTNFGGGTFAGSLRDNGATQFAFSQFSGSSIQTLTGTNTYTGATSINSGQLAFAGGGSALNTASLSLSSGCVLTLDNSGTAVGNRLPDGAAISASGGRISFTGNATTAVSETLGALQYAGAVAIDAAQPGAAAAQLNFAGAARTSGATLNITGSGGVSLAGVVNGANGIIAPYVTAGSEWAVVGSGGNVQALTNYSTNPATAGATDHVKITAASTTLAGGAATTWNTLNLQNSVATTQTLDVGAGRTLALAGGGLLSSGTGAAVISNGTLAAAGELVVTNRNALTINSAITETAANTAFTKNGEGTLALTGNNTYSGTTHLTQGVLAVSSDQNLGTGAAISFDGGTLQATGNFNTTKNLTRSTALVEVINTNGFNVTVGGTNSALQQSGTGTLTLTNPATGATYTSAGGTLALPNAASGTSNLQGGMLRAAGMLDQVMVSASSTLDVGGSGAQTLTLGNFNDQNGSGTVTVRFTLGSTVKDRLVIQSSSLPFSGGSSALFLYTIDTTGGLQTGVNYSVLELPNGPSAYTSGLFALSPESLAAGYQGAFLVGANAVTLSFTAVPEPGTWMLLSVGGAIVLIVATRRRLRPRLEIRT